jgi:hypothetical protein
MLSRSGAPSAIPPIMRVQLGILDGLAERRLSRFSIVFLRVVFV